MKNVSRSFVGIFSAVTGALVVAAAVHFNLLAAEPTKNPKLSLNVDTSPMVRDVKAGTSFAPIVKKAAPSVVNIYSTTIVHVHPMQSPFMMDPFFRQFFGDQFQGQNRDMTRKEQSLGSGVIVSPDGYILTANHVVRDADEVKVALGDDNQKKYDARVVGTDPRTDVAVLKIEAKNLPAITFGDSSQVEIGDVVLAIGNPFGVGQTVTEGIISALGRHGYGINGPRGYEDFIQTDAAINPGNSGGALVDAEGRLIGINTWIATSSGGSEGVGFAVPANLARRVMESLIANGKVTRGYLGVSIKDLTPGLAKAFGYDKEGGALVGDVFPDTPAAKAGIEDGDIIIEFNGKKISDANSLTLMVSECAPGSEASVKVFRKGVSKTLNVKLEELPNENGKNGNSENNANSTTDALDGVTVQDVDTQARQELNIPNNIKGALVVSVDDNSNAADAGLQKGDVIMEIDQKAVKDSDDAVKLAQDVKGDQILLKIWRREGDMASTTYITVDNTKRKK
ncbi:MAG TPA: DegQ family serine endoprotease [Verrucomicrobiae bacterium]|nr:DegQ family serine endoprotease [Verrucomicrobiae bacterium]